MKTGWDAGKIFQGLFDQVLSRTPGYFLAVFVPSWLSVRSVVVSFKRFPVSGGRTWGTKSFRSRLPAPATNGAPTRALPVRWITLMKDDMCALLRRSDAED